MAEWESRGKTIAQLIKELQTFEDQNMEIRLSMDCGDTSVPISLVGKITPYAMLMNCEGDSPSLIRHYYRKPGE